jgi:hypothetical protein
MKMFTQKLCLPTVVHLSSTEGEQTQKFAEDNSSEKTVQDYLWRNEKLLNINLIGPWDFTC